MKKILLTLTLLPLGRVGRPGGRCRQPNCSATGR